MEESILKTIRKLVTGSDDTCFDMDIIILINGEFMILNQLGIGPTEGFSIEDDTKKWSDYIGTNKNFESVKSYIYIKVKLVFDPPSSSFVVDALERKIKELEWRFTRETDQLTTIEGGTTVG